MGCCLRRSGSKLDDSKADTPNSSCQCFLGKLDSFADWMSFLPPQLHGVALKDIAIPGSHDSATKSLDKDGPFNPAESDSKAIEDIIKFTGSIGRSVVYNWSVTQDFDVFEQLTAGIRYFDIRVAVKPNDPVNFYVTHGFYGRKVIEIMKEIVEFLSAHPKEIVLVDCNHFYGMSSRDHERLVAELCEVFQGIMCPYLGAESATLDVLWENDLRVLLFYHDDAAVAASGFLWPGTAIPSPWPDTMDAGKVIQFLQSNLDRGRPADSFYVSQGILTPSTGTIVGHLCASLKVECGIPALEALVPWLKGKSAGPKSVNVVLADFVGLHRFIELVVSINCVCRCSDTSKSQS